MLSPLETGIATDRIRVSVDLMPIKFDEASVLYPQVLIARVPGVVLDEGGRCVPRLSIWVSDNGLM